MEKSPDAFRTISEVAEHLETPAHVLRFWESRFPQIRPVKRAGGRRYYRPADVALLTGIKRLLHDEGMTIRGVQKILREQGVRFVSGMVDEPTSDEDADLDATLTASASGEPPVAPQRAAVIPLSAGKSPATEPDVPAPAVSEPSPDESAATASSTQDADRRLDDLFERFGEMPAAEDTADASEEAVETIDFAPTLAGGARQDRDTTAPATDIGAAPAAASEDEAPMAVWAEEADFAAEDGGEPVNPPPLKVTRIGAVPDARDAAPAPDDDDRPALPAVQPTQTLAARLRRTSAESLSSTDRSDITVLRARARSLRDRLSSGQKSSF